MRLKPTDRKRHILAAALADARKRGYMQVTLLSVADAAECSRGLVIHYFATMQQLRRAVMRAAIANRDLPIVAQGLAARDAQALKAPEDLRKAALASIAG